MKREVEREVKLQAFAITVGELELLWDRLSKLFDDPEKIYSSIDIRLPNEQLEFKDVEELKRYQPLHGSVTKFWIRLAQGGRRISIRAGGTFTSRGEVTAAAESEAWCAGAIETVTSFVNSHKLWYSWFVRAPIGWGLVIIANLPSIVPLFRGGTLMDKPMMYAWIAAFLTVGLLYVAKSWLLPAAILRISEEQGFLRRHGPELSLIIALASAILTVIGWFVGK